MWRKHKVSYVHLFLYVIEITTGIFYLRNLDWVHERNNEKNLTTYISGETQKLVGENWWSYKVD